MKTNEDIERYLISLELQYESLDQGLWLVHAEPAEVVVAHTPPVVVFRVKVMNEPAGNHLALYKKLLELNAQDLVHGAYGLEDGAIVLTDALQSENLDLNEFQASVESLQMAVVDHRELLAPFNPAS